ncbi:MAG: O-antigen ligase family protein [Firmicutes bacterium]|nr:O-antigen ligase family protein [Bacillota bacterium]
MLSISWSSFEKLTFQRSALIFTPATLLFLAAHSDRRHEETFWRIAIGMAIFGTSLAAIGLIVYAFGKTDLSLAIQTLRIGPLKIVQVVTASEPVTRISSFCSNPNALAAWLLITIPLTLALFLGRKISALSFTILSGMQAMALLLTFSRAGIMVAAIASALLILLSAPSGFAFAKRVYLLIAISVVFGLLAYLFLFNSHSGLPDRFSISLAGRESAWSASWNYFLKHPFTGVGFGVSQETILNPIGWSATAHNCYITVLSEIGLVGFLLFIGLWLLAIVVLVQKILSCKRQGLSRECLILIAAASILIALMPYQIFETTILRSGFHMLFWIYLIALSTQSSLEVDN